VPCDASTSICRSFATICSELRRFAYPAMARVNRDAEESYFESVDRKIYRMCPRARYAKISGWRSHSRRRRQIDCVNQISAYGAQETVPNREPMSGFEG
jgi:hypothetical protein